MAFRIPSFRRARTAREFQVATRSAQRPVSCFPCGWLAPFGVALGLISCVRQLPHTVELEPLAPAPPPSFAGRLEGIDIAHIDFHGGARNSDAAGGSDGDLRIATVEGSMAATDWALGSKFRGGPVPQGDRGYHLGGHPVRLMFAHGPLMFDGDGVPPDSKRVIVEVVWIDAPPLGPAQTAVEFLSALDPADRATVWIHEGTPGASVAPPERLGLAPMRLHAQHMAELVLAAEAEALAAIPAGAPFADNGAVPISEAALENFLEFCEAELLVRRGSDILVSHAAPADAWFGGAVRLKAGSGGASLVSLAAVMHQLYLEHLDVDQPTGGDFTYAERLHSPSVTDEWAVPRFMLLREMMGATEFRSLLRSFVDTHRSGAPVGWEEFATAAEAAAPDFGARFVRSWLRNSTEPKVKASWAYDEPRGRVLLRVDQVHKLQGGAAAPAFPFRLPIRVTNAAGEVSDHTLAVNKRRSVLEVPAQEAPVRVEIDPDGRLRALMSLELFVPDSIGPDPIGPDPIGAK